MSWWGQLERTLEKNVPEIRALITGRLRRILQGPAPVFCYHRVDPMTLESDLEFLAVNGYRTLSAEELRTTLEEGAGTNEGQSVCLTFDDATADFWTTAHPLLEKYGFNAVLFAIPGLTREGRPRPTLEDAWSGEVTEAEVLRGTDDDALCNWSELERIHEAGLVDIQSHSLTHRRVPVSNRVIDFLHPSIDRSGFRNVDIPAEAGTESRELRLGRPIFRSASRLSGRRRFLEDRGLNAAMVAYVQERGGKSFFERSGWERELRRVYRRRRKSGAPGAFETEAAMLTEVTRELARSKEELESRLPGKRVEHICYPWFQGSGIADEAAASLGYRLGYSGIGVRRGFEPGRSDILVVPRVPADFINGLATKNGPAESSFKSWLFKAARQLSWAKEERKS